jgi:hypothetical protein
MPPAPPTPDSRGIRTAPLPSSPPARSAEVRQSIRDPDGKPLKGQTHGLKDKTVGHVFRFRDGKVARFDIEDAGETG